MLEMLPPEINCGLSFKVLFALSVLMQGGIQSIIANKIGLDLPCLLTREVSHVPAG